MMTLKNKYPEDHNDQADKEHKEGNAVDPMHILHPLGMRCLRIPLFNVEIFAKLPPDAHKK
jgi:hypothetical protein